MSVLTIDEVTATGRTLEATITPPRELRRFFTGDPFYAEYPVDIETVPESILVLPVLAHVTPVAWTRNVDVHCQTADRQFVDSLSVIQENLREMYPAVIKGGDVIAEHPTTANTESGERTAQLFTGGIDSLATYIRHREEAPSLVSINGWTESLDDEIWERRKTMLRTYGDRFEVQNHFVRSNMLRFIDHTMLIAHFKRHVIGSWYSALASGLGLSGIAAPLTYAQGIDTLYIASSVSPKREHAWGSHPDIDPHIGWSGTEVIHDAYPISRQEKVELVVDFAEDQWPDLPIRTCNSLVDANCGHCEKCYRTAVSLVLAGRDPNVHGYEFDEDDWAHVRQHLEDGSWDLRSSWVNWGNIQDFIEFDRPYPIEGADAFFQWLADADLEDLRDRTGPEPHERALRAIARNTPHEIYSRLYPVYRQLTGAESR